jgi:thiol:disulfide interchange protein DsbD
MALPYALVSARPALVRLVPRSGPGTRLVKQVLGLFLMAVGSYFLGIGVGAIAGGDGGLNGVYWWVVAAFVTAGSAWMAYRTFKLSRSALVRVSVAGAALAITLTGVSVARAFTRPPPVMWARYTDAILREAIADRKVVVLDFTAEWCLNCKVLEVGVLNRPAVSRLLADPDVLLLRADLTRENAAGRRKLEELGWIGIPALAVYGPALETPVKYDSYTARMIVEAIRQARGTD